MNNISVNDLHPNATILQIAHKDKTITQGMYKGHNKNKILIEETLLLKVIDGKWKSFRFKRMQYWDIKEIDLAIMEI